MMEKKFNNYVCSIVCGLLTAFGIAASVISLINSNGAYLLFDVFSLVLAVLVGYYALFGYKLPHGNLLKYIILAYAVFVYIGIPNIAKDGITWRIILQGIVTGLLCYMAGRLDRIKENVLFIL